MKEGRKLERVGEFLYHIINYEYYRAIKNQADRREANRVAQATYRAKKKGEVGLKNGKPLKGEVEYLDRVRKHGQAAADAEFDRRER